MNKEMRRAVQRWLLGMSVAAVLAGCGGALVQSRTGYGEAGFVYYLPKQLVKVQVIRSAVPVGVGAQLVEALDTQHAARAIREQRADAVEVSELALGELRRDSDEYKALAKELSGLRLSLQKAQAQLTLSDRRVDALHAQIAKDKPAIAQYRDTLTITALAPVADREQRYVAQMPRRAGRSDDLTLMSNEAGLLSSGDLSSTDHTADVIVASIESLGGLMQVPVALGGSRARWLDFEGGSRESSCALRPFTYEAVLDVLNVAEVNHFNEELMGERYCSQVALAVNPTGPVLRKTEDADRTEGCIKVCNNASAEDELSGIRYRRKLPYVLTVSNEFGLLHAVAIELPNGSSAERLPLDGVALARADHDVKFENGMLVEHHAVRPSSALAIAKAPGQVAQAIVAIPAQLFQLRIDTTKQQAELSKEELALLKQVAELEAERARQATNADPDTTPTVDPDDPTNE